MRSSLRQSLALSVALTVSGAGVVRAHDPGLSVVTARVQADTLLLHLAMSGVDADNTELGSQVHTAFSVTCDGRHLGMSKATARHDDRGGVQLDFSFPGLTNGQLAIRSTLLQRMPRGHRQFISLQDQANHRLGEQMLDAGHDELTVALASHSCDVCRVASDGTTARHPSLVTRHSSREFLCLGVEHIATGYDHLLFLLGLLIVGGSLRAALKIITSFTLAHSITLALATLNIISIPPRVIEPLIAASIVFVGVQNIFSPDAGKRWLLTFGFGLIHGCGFASALRDLGIGANGGSIVVPLLSFNLGVELGQLAIAALVLPLIWKCRSSPMFVRRLVPIGSAMIVVAGGYWLVERTLF